MKIIPAIISFKTKIKTLHGGEEYIDYKRRVHRSDCNLTPCQHDYYNSDLFIGMLNRAYQKAINNHKWCELSRLPENVKVTKGKFLSEVTINIEV